ncbi:DUF1345 domain-containing protein [Streptomyces sp. SBR177]
MRRWIPQAALVRLGCSLALGLVLGVVVGLLAGPALGILGAIAAAETAFVLAGWTVLVPMDAEETRRNARREELDPLVEELVGTSAATSALVAIVLMLVVGDTDTRAAAAVALAGVFMAWANLHLMYATRYADLYYREPVGGIDFNTRERPRYTDFLYFSYNLGMTYQVSDTAVADSRLRVVILRHCLLSYVFGTSVLATTINLVTQAFTG